jgi:y4mF family transcriptional regulator
MGHIPLFYRRLRLLCPYGTLPRTRGRVPIPTHELDGRIQTYPEAIRRAFVNLQYVAIFGVRLAILGNTFIVFCVFCCTNSNDELLDQQMNAHEIGYQLTDRRKKLGLRQSDLASLAGVSLRTLIAIEQGAANPSFETLAKIVDVLGMELALVVKS